MPRFFFHIVNGNGFTEDEEGQELPDAERARAIAVDSARSLLSAEVSRGELDLTGRIEVADAGGKPLMAVKFDEVVEIRRGEPPALPSDQKQPGE